jgi:hypothetical protein
MGITTPQGFSAKARSGMALSAIGLLLMGAAILYGAVRLSKLREQISKKTATLTAIKDEIAALNNQIERIRNGPLPDLVTPRAVAILRPGLRDREGRQLFNFMVWLNVPHVRQSEIREVRYFFGDSSFLSNRKTGSEASNGFAVGYLGWGAMTSVPIEVVPNQGPAFRIDFRMHEQMEIVGR